MALAPNMPNPNTTYLQQGNGQVLLSWQYVAGATGYKIQRSTDGITYALLASPTLNSYVDTTVTPGQLYYYQLAATNTGGDSSYTPPQSIVPTLQGQASLGSLRLAAMQRADRVNNNFVTVPEWNYFLNQSLSELYDIMVQAYEEYFVAAPAYFTTNNVGGMYPVPDGVAVFQDAAGNAFVPPPMYKLLGVDLGLNNAPNGFVTVKRFNFIDRNKYVFPNTASTIYGVFNLQYRLVGNQIEFIPIPSSNQPIRLWYIPRMNQLLQDTDVFDAQADSWFQYVIIRAAKYALDKEESDTTKLDDELLFLKKTIEESAPNRDVGQADTISDTRRSSGMGPYGGNPGGTSGLGW